MYNYNLQFFGGRGASAGTTGGRKAKLGDFLNLKVIIQILLILKR